MSSNQVSHSEQKKAGSSSPRTPSQRVEDAFAKGVEKLQQGSRKAESVLRQVSAALSSDKKPKWAEKEVRRIYGQGRLVQQAKDEAYAAKNPKMYEVKGRQNSELERDANGRLRLKTGGGMSSNPIELGLRDEFDRNGLSGYLKAVTALVVSGALQTAGERVSA